MKSTGKPPVVVSLVTSQKNQPKLISVISVNPFMGGKKHSKRHDLYWVETPPIRRIWDCDARFSSSARAVLASSQSRNNLQPSEFSGYQKQGDLTSCCSEFNNFFLNEKFNSLFLAQLCSLRAWQHVISLSIDAERFRFLSHDDIQGLRGDIYGRSMNSLSLTVPLKTKWK